MCMDTVSMCVWVCVGMHVQSAESARVAMVTCEECYFHFLLYLFCYANTLPPGAHNFGSDLNFSMQ